MRPQAEDTESDFSRFLRFGEFEVDLRDETVRRGGETLNVNHRMFQVLRVLMEREGEIVSKNEFFEKVWAGSFVEENNLSVTVRALRKVLGDDAKQARYIENVPRKGYRFIARIESVFSPSVTDRGSGLANGRSSEASSADLSPLSEQSPRTASRFLVGVLSAIVIAGFALAAIGWNGSWMWNAPTVSRPDSVAVLPFVVQNPASEYIADGLTEGIINELARMARLRVIDRNSAFQYRGRPTDAWTAGRELNVRAIVTGHVEQIDDVLIIKANLIDLTTNSILWQGQFRRRSDEVYATQQEISRTILTQLRVESTDAADLQRPVRTTDPKAHDLYLKGRYFWNKRSTVNFRKAAEHFRSALDLDPTFAEAYIGLADAYTLGDLSEFGFTLEEKNAMVRGSIQKALAIDPNQGGAYAALAINKCYYDWDFKGAEADYVRALALAPNNATARHWYAEFLSMLGRFDESIREYERARSLDPLSLPIRADMAYSYYYARDFDKVIDLLNKIKELHPQYQRTYLFLSATYREKGMFRESTDTLEKFYDLQFESGEASEKVYKRQKQYIADLRTGLKSSGRDGYWGAVLDYRLHDPYEHAIAKTNLGMFDEAFHDLEVALKNRYSGLVWLRTTPELDALRSDARYALLLSKVGL
jgi:TolB-like protein/DNA-binding winged helix-turn-helix (wHTH) protein/tetratricopeptide (TPR) repeat protein